MKTVVCYVYGEAKGNPGAAAIGVFVVDKQGVMISETAQGIGNADRNFAEYYAVMTGLQTLVGLYGVETKTMEFELCLSNELVLKQLNAESPINNPGLVPMFIEIHNMQVVSFPNVTFTYIAHDQNTNAARLANEVLD